MANQTKSLTDLTGPTVMTVLGPISADRLGRVLVHEHLQIVNAGQELDRRTQQSRREIVHRAVDRLCELKDIGVGTFVDPCPIELGRDVELMAEVSERSGVNIVCGTGFYFESDGVGIPYYWRMRWPEEIAEFYASEIQDGVGSTGIRPGIIKAATGRVVGKHERKALKGAALAAKSTGLPIITHTTGGQCGLEQQDIFSEDGVELGSCLIGHQDEAESLAVLESIAARGSFVGIDRVGYHTMVSDEERARRVVGLVKAGYSCQVCISQDHLCVGGTGRPASWIPKARAAEYRRDTLPKRTAEAYGRPSTYIFTHFVPRLLELGLDAETIEGFFVRNPRRLLVGSEE